MAAKTKRIEMRADPDSEAKIVRAAALQSVSVSAFVLRAAGQEAERVLGQADQTLMPAAEFDALMDSLEVADPAPRLKAAARKRRAFTRR